VVIGVLLVTMAVFSKLPVIGSAVSFVIMWYGICGVCASRLR
jgi:hypothetical protein